MSEKFRQVAHDNMMKRLRANLAPEEMYLVAMAFITLQSRFDTEREKTVEAFGTFGADAYEMLLSNAVPIPN